MPKSPDRVLVVDDDAAMRHMLQTVLNKNGYEVFVVGEAKKALALLQTDLCDLVLCDVRMPKMDGFEFLAALKESGIETTVIMMSAYGSVASAIDCMKIGAYDYISKPFKPDEVILTLEKAKERLRLRRENAGLREALASNCVQSDSSGLVWQSDCMAQIANLVVQVADSRSPVLITGETGTGKELVARSLYTQGDRAERPFIAVNCGAIPANLIESTLFGHVKGAFTGADTDKKGLFSAANGGTLFLDEIGELPLELQPRLLRVLQENEILRVGETLARKIDVRVIAATARDLEAEVVANEFRDDLFYRLAVIEIRLPPLRERKEDIGILAAHLASKIALRNGRPVPELGSGVVAALKEYDWPGNVRELENFLEKTMIFCRGELIESQDLPWSSRRHKRESADDLSLKVAYGRIEKEYIRKALAQSRGNKTQAATLLEISLRTLHYKMKELDL